MSAIAMLVSACCLVVVCLLAVPVVRAYVRLWLRRMGLFSGVGSFTEPMSHSGMHVLLGSLMVMSVVNMLALVLLLSVCGLIIAEAIVLQCRMWFLERSWVKHNACFAMYKSLWNQEVLLLHLANEHGMGGGLSVSERVQRIEEKLEPRISRAWLERERTVLAQRAVRERPFWPVRISREDAERSIMADTLIHESAHAS